MTDLCQAKWCTNYQDLIDDENVDTVLVAVPTRAGGNFRLSYGYHWNDFIRSIHTDKGIKVT